MAAPTGATSVGAHLQRAGLANFNIGLKNRIQEFQEYLCRYSPIVNHLAQMAVDHGNESMINFRMDKERTIGRRNDFSRKLTRSRNGMEGTMDGRNGQPFAHLRIDTVMRTTTAVKNQITRLLLDVKTRHRPSCAAVGFVYNTPYVQTCNFAAFFGGLTLSVVEVSKTVITASVTSCPRYSSAVFFIFWRMIAEISCGV